MGSYTLLEQIGNVKRKMIDHFLHRPIPTIDVINPEKVSLLLNILYNIFITLIIIDLDQFDQACIGWLKLKKLRCR